MTAKTKKVLMIAAPILIGVAVIVYLNRRRKKGGGDANTSDTRPSTSTPVGSTKSSASNAFLKQGSTGSLVKQLQAALNKYGSGLTVDGVWGPKTQAALQSKLGITEIVSRSQFDKIITDAHRPLGQWGYVPTPGVLSTGAGMAGFIR